MQQEQDKRKMLEAQLKEQPGETGKQTGDIMEMLSGND